MGNTLICYPDRTVEAATTFSGGSWNASFPLTNLQNKLLSKVARSTNATVASTQFVATYAAPIDVRLISLLNHNISLAGTIRVRGYSDASLTQLVYDTTPASANVFTYPNDLDNAVWTKGNVTVTVNATTDPNSTTTADKLVETAVTANFTISRNNNIASNVTQDAYVYVKAAERDRIRLYLYDSSAPANTVYADFYITTPSVSNATNGGAGTGVNAEIESVGAGWYKCKISGKPGISANSATVAVFIMSAANTITYLGDATKGIYLWGMSSNVTNYTYVWPQTFTTSMIASWPNNWTWPIPSIATAKYWKTEIADTANAAGYVQFGRSWLGPVALEPTIGIPEGAELGYEPRTVLAESLGGVLWANRRTSKRSFIGTFPRLTSAEKQTALITQKTLDTSGEMFFVRNKLDSADNMLLHAFPVLARKVSPLRLAYQSASEMGVEFVEII